jgi:1,4-dihydroxy-2-naphthoate octaprenyltransferase
MAKKELRELSNEELLKNEKKIKAFIGVFSGLLFILFIAIILLSVKKGISVLVATPIALLPLLIVMLNNWNDLKKEIKLRNL